ncbi:hypothetical protein ACFYP7_31210 [Micromonospora arida]|uniref:hypothetical protein n=1 Tax=Micromonospora arida TaxID=2203715 RepID=UPI0036829937
MTVFACFTCGVVVTGDLVESTLPDESSARSSNDGSEAIPRLRSGQFAVDPEPFGPPHVPTANDPHVLVSNGSRGTILINPGDVRGLELHPDRNRRNGCCRLDGLDGPNLVCPRCGSEIATEQSDCWVSWYDIRLEPAAVMRLNHKA